MKRLSPKEEEIMRMFWSKGPMFVRDLLELYNEPKPHYNTVMGHRTKRILRIERKEYQTY